MTTTGSEWVSVGGPVDETEVSILLHGEFDPDDITSLTGLQPSAHHRKGEVAAPGRQPSKGDFWSFELKVKAPEDAEDAIWRILSMLPMDDDFWRRLEGKAEVFVSVLMVVKAWNRGFRLSPPLLQELNRRGATLDFSIYAEPQQMASACLA